MAQHSTLSPADGIHKPYSFEFADASARASATNSVPSSAYTSADVGKIALQTDDGSIWRLTATTPTWAKIAQQTDVDAVNTALTTHTSDTSNPHSVTAAQTGAATSSALTTHTGDTANPHSVTLAQIGALNAGSVTSISPSNYTPSAATLAGNLSGIDTALASAGGGSPGGSNGQIQYNDGGEFAGSAAKVSAAGAVDLPEITAPSTPSSGFASIYISDDPNSAAAAPPRIHTKDSAGLVRTIYPAIERQGVGSLTRTDASSKIQLGPKTTETTASFTDSTTEFIVMALVRLSPSVVPTCYTGGGREVFSAVSYRGGYAQTVDVFKLSDARVDLSIRDGANAKTSFSCYNAGSPIGVFVFHQTEDLTVNFGRKGIGCGIPGQVLNLSAWVDYSTSGASNNGGRLEFGFSNGSALLALGVCDGRAGSAGAGTHPWSAATTNAFATNEEATLSYMKAHDTFMREGTIRNLSTAEIGGSNALVWDKLYLPSDATVDSDGKLTAWPANSASADTSAPDITLANSASGDSYRFPVTWFPGA